MSDVADRGSEDREGSPLATRDVTDEILSGKTYRSLGEQTLSPAEERFEKSRRTIGLFVGPLALLVMLFLPLGLPPEQQRLAAVLTFVIIYWISEAIPIPMTGMIGAVLCVLLGVGSADDVFGPFGSSTIFLFIGAFIIAQAMLTHGLARRFAYRVLALPGTSKSTARTIITFGAITALLSAFVSNTATVAMLLPTAVGILGAYVAMMRESGGDVPRNAGMGGPEARGGRASDQGSIDPTKLRLGTALMLMLAYGASVGGLLTPVGSPPNIIGRGLIEEATGQTIGFFEWFLVALPVCLAMFVVLSVVLLLLNKPEVKHLPGLDEHVAEERRKLGGFSAAERNTLIAFGVAVFLWILPGLVGLIAGDTSDVYSQTTDLLDEGVVAIIGAGLLFLLPTNWNEREFTLNWSDAANIDWGTILLFGSGIIFGSLLDDTGLAETIGTGIQQTFGVTGFVGITIFAVLLAILISETTSNTASASVVVPIVLPVAVAAGINPFVPALAATFAASFGFMLPVSTPQNAIIYGSGVVPITKMVRTGIVFDILGGLLIVVGIPLMVALLGVGG